MTLTFVQRFFRQVRVRNFISICKGVPIVNTFLQPQLNRYFFGRAIIIFTLVIPFIGLFRRAYMKNKFNQYLASKSETAELELKQSLQKFEVKMPNQVDYMAIVCLDQFKEMEGQNISDVDKENSSKIFTLIDDAQNNVEALQLKWAFLGSRKLFEAIDESRKSIKKSHESFNIEFHQAQKQKKQAKVYLLAREGDGEKVIMEWNVGVTLKEIQKYIARHKYKKYLQQITF